MAHSHCILVFSFCTRKCSGVFSIPKKIQTLFILCWIIGTSFCKKCFTHTHTHVCRFVNADTWQFLYAQTRLIKCGHFLNGHKSPSGKCYVCRYVIASGSSYVLCFPLNCFPHTKHNILHLCSKCFQKPLMW